MPKPREDLEVKKPVSVLFRPLTVNLQKLSVSFIKALVDGAQMKATDVAKDIADGIEALGLKGNTPGELAHRLICQASVRALQELLWDYRSEFDSTKSQHLESSVPKTAPDDSSFLIDESFFRHPRRLPFLKQFQSSLEQALRAGGLSESDAKALGNRLPHYFAYSLHVEWCNDPVRYAPILQALDSPFGDAWKRDEEWNRYLAWLEQQAEESVFEETFSLRSIYIPLRAYYVRKASSPKGKAKDVPGDAADTRDNRRDPREERVVVDLQEALGTWRERQDKNDAVRLISGGPGAGKSSFLKVWAATLAEQSVRALFVPLHHLDLRGTVTDAIGEYLKNVGHFENNPADPANAAEAPLLILFDGLDELSAQGKVGADTAKAFLEEVDRLVGQRNQAILQLQVVVSGRTVSLQDAEKFFKKEQQILDALPYFLAEEEDDSARYSYTDPQRLLSEDQRLKWWAKYSNLTTGGLEDMPPRLSYDDLVEITAQPLLNYLLALALREEVVSLDNDMNLNSIYAGLLEALYRRRYEKHEGHRAIKELSQSDYSQVLEEIALLTWHSGGRTTTVRAIQEHLEGGRLGKVLKIFCQKAEDGVGRLLLGFYFRRAGANADGDAAFEFTHKSFGEYLTARRIVRVLKSLVEELDRNDKSSDLGRSERQCVISWRECCGATAIDPELYKFVKREVAANGKNNAQECQAFLCRLIDYVLRNGSPMDKLSGLDTFPEVLEQVRNAEGALLVLLSACSAVTGKVSNVNWPDDESASKWIQLLRPVWYSGPQVLPVRYLARLNLAEQSLWKVTFQFADLSLADLRGADLTYADLTHADLTDANLTHADLTGASLRSADLVGANLNGANLNDADLVGADLVDADLTYADLTYADLTSAKLTHADLRSADLTGAKLDQKGQRLAKKCGAILD